MQHHTESTAGQPSWLLRLVGDLQRYSGGKITTLNKGPTEKLGKLTSDGDDEKLRGEMSVGEIIKSEKKNQSAKQISAEIYTGATRRGFEF